MSMKSKLVNVLSFAHLAGLRLRKNVEAANGAAGASNAPPAPRSQATSAGQRPEERPAAAAGHTAGRDAQRGPTKHENQDDARSEMVGSSVDAEARKSERARCAAILMSDAGQRNFEMAKQLAFETRLTRKEAIALLEATPAPLPRGSFAHPERAARNPKVGIAVPAVSREQAIGARWDRALRAANPGAKAHPTHAEPASHATGMAQHPR